MEPGSEDLVRSVIRCLRLDELAHLAAQRVGCHNSDIGCGVSYPESLDDRDREDGIDIPPGHIWVSARWGKEVVNAPEAEYYEILAQELELEGRVAQAARVRALIAT